MKLITLLAGACAALALPSIAAEPGYRKDIAPLLEAQCASCHSTSAPTLQEFNLDKEKYTKSRQGPRIDSYENLLMIVAYPDAGALMRRLDDGSNAADKKPGNMHKYLGATDTERASNLELLKSWVGDGGWNLNRWEARGAVPAVTKAQLDKLKLRY